VDLVHDRLDMTAAEPSCSATMVLVIMYSCSQCRQERGGESPYKFPGPDFPKGGPGPDNVAYVFVFVCSIIICPLYKLSLSDQAKSLSN
jgi:hypothetical protein